MIIFVPLLAICKQQFFRWFDHYQKNSSSMNPNHHTQLVQILHTHCKILSFPIITLLHVTLKIKFYSERDLYPEFLTLLYVIFLLVPNMSYFLETPFKGGLNICWGGNHLRPCRRTTELPAIQWWLYQPRNKTLRCFFHFNL